MTELSGRVRIAPGYRLQWEPAQQAEVLLYPEGMVQLNPSAGMILRLCDGQLDAAGIVAALKAQFPDADLAADVRDFLEVAYERGWLRGE